eukprot:CAMPEP_0206134528 /NCGR_PEP_ID=MMETSP1473-20131121/61_1 /ASSEMBLY_ACC=CAM_ASM_001109 /TAXON_ID=1461547 /ORGANISM="Stichococcus sp, Strain RCC1054" /LENGTH=54 /DNA_ID=CAMNT_0053526143 /DNA_START=354 /DNA_END=518 /DNA_ORIENTATION=+
MTGAMSEAPQRMLNVAEGPRQDIDPCRTTTAAGLTSAVLSNRETFAQPLPTQIV